MAIRVGQLTSRYLRTAPVRVPAQVPLPAAAQRARSEPELGVHSAPESPELPEQSQRAEPRSPEQGRRVAPEPGRPAAAQRRSSAAGHQAGPHPDGRPRVEALPQARPDDRPRAAAPGGRSPTAAQARDVSAAGEARGLSKAVQAESAAAVCWE
jgi:hypothetical protein